MGLLRVAVAERVDDRGVFGVVALLPLGGGDAAFEAAPDGIADLVGHAGTNTTETVYRHQLRPVITGGAEVMDKIFKT